ncbi:MAG: hypothetical protein ACI97A_001025, partial [Planctomycetota bacterium]
ANALKLFAEGNSIPFVARYRKEMIRGIDELALREVSNSAAALNRLQERCQTIIDKLEENERLTPAIQRALEHANTLGELEEIYRPFKTSRLTKADIAREAGLNPLAKELLSNKRDQTAKELAKPFVSPERGIDDVKAAVDGAISILAERISQMPRIRREAKLIIGSCFLIIKKKRGYSGEDRRFEDLYDHKSPWPRIPGHRFLAIMRGEKAGALSLKFDYDRPTLLNRMATSVLTDLSRLKWSDLKEAIETALRRFVAPAVCRELTREKKDTATTDAVRVFGKNLRDLLLSPPAGPRVILALDPGFRAGCKLAVINQNGSVKATHVVFPTPPRLEAERSKFAILDLIKEFKVELLALGTGQGSRETFEFLRQQILPSARVEIVRVSEAGASVYSASKLAVEELPNLDISFRGAVSIARRLQDPLSELVKIEPRSLGVGQYQHDIEESTLTEALEGEIESCVNKVGVDLNTASAELLRHVAGLDRRTAKSIVQHRAENGTFQSREDLRPVKGIGDSSFMQCAGFLRIRNGEESLDSTGIHPESYEHARWIAKELGSDCDGILGQEIKLTPPQRQELESSGCGNETLEDILQELSEPGRDPRSEFETVDYRDDITSINDLEIGMPIEGTVSNVTDFGAFVDIGLETDGLVHISELSEKRIRSPHEVVCLGQLVKTQVLSVDLDRNRIALTMIVGSNDAKQRDR